MAANRIDGKLRELALESVEHGKSHRSESSAVWAQLRELGTELWLDTGNLEEAKSLWCAEFTALTTNNTLANQVVQTGILDDVVKETVHDLIDAEPNISEESMIMELGFVVNCHIALRLVKELGARVSVELHPDVAEDIDRTVYYAERYFAVCPENFTIKIPLSPEGFCAVARCRAQGIPINYTLGFSARQNYLAAALSNPNYVNVFLGRLNNVVQENHLGDGKNIGEKAALASQNAITALRKSGKSGSRQIMASMREASQVNTLAGSDVFTMPPKVAKAFAESNPAQVASHLEADLPVSVTDPQRTAVLWEVNNRVRAMADDLVGRGGVNLTGEDLREADADHGAGLFHRFNSADVVDIREHGKIPDLKRWEMDEVALDELMTQHALQSFAVDQAALDDRLRGLTRAK